MQQELYPNQDFLQAPRRRYLICGFMDLTYGGPFVCFLWIVRFAFCFFLLRWIAKLTAPT